MSSEHYIIKEHLKNIKRLFLLPFICFIWFQIFHDILKYLIKFLLCQFLWLLLSLAIQLFEKLVMRNFLILGQHLIDSALSSILIWLSSSEWAISKLIWTTFNASAFLNNLICWYVCSTCSIIAYLCLISPKHILTSTFIQSSKVNRLRDLWTSNDSARAFWNQLKWRLWWIYLRLLS